MGCSSSKPSNDNKIDLSQGAAPDVVVTLPASLTASLVSGAAVLAAAEDVPLSAFTGFCFGMALTRHSRLSSEMSAGGDT